MLLVILGLLPWNTSSWEMIIYHVGKMCKSRFHDGLKTIKPGSIARLFRFINMPSAFCCAEGASNVNVSHTRGLEVGVCIRVIFFLLFNSF